MSDSLERSCARCGGLLVYVPDGTLRCIREFDNKRLHNENKR